MGAPPARGRLWKRSLLALRSRFRFLSIFLGISPGPRLFPCTPCGLSTLLPLRTVCLGPQAPRAPTGRYQPAPGAAKGGEAVYSQQKQDHVAEPLPTVPSPSLVCGLGVWLQSGVCFDDKQSASSPAGRLGTHGAEIAGPPGRGPLCATQGKRRGSHAPHKNVVSCQGARA